MRPYKIILFISLSIGLVPCIASAQPATAPAQERGQRGAAMFERLERAMDQLDLAEDQKAKLREIIEKARSELREAGAQLRDMQPQQRVEIVREKIEGVLEEIKGVLDEDQRAMFQDAVGRLREGVRRGADAAGQARPGQFAQRVREAIDQLDLSGEQTTEVTRLLDEMQAKLRTVRQELQDDMEEFRVKAREITNETRLELQELLSPEQQQKLREILEERVNPRGRQRREDAPPPEMPPPPQMPPEEPAGGPDPKDQPPPSDPKDNPRAALPSPIHPLVGQPSPDFALTKLDGRRVELSSFNGRILVLLFGNYSSPAFRDRADDYEQLRKQYANRADLLIVYTREAHPVGGWEVERNKSDKVAVEQPKDEAGRKALAEQAKRALKITIPIAIDVIDDSTARSYGAASSVAAVVIGRDGTVLAHRKWGDAHVLRRDIDDAIAKS